ncbi:MAG: ABC transporter substrate-binding protein [Clostridiales bacterium]|nr:ABC transporter substrate-binding protein [Clostridiales bacterium]
MKKLLVLLLLLTLVVSIAGCAPKEEVTGDIETETPVEEVVNNTPLVVGYSAFSEKFSPFFASTAYDIDASTLTQVNLLKTDRSGGIIYNSIEGETVAYNGVDYFYNGISDIKVDYDETSDITTYNIKIRDDVKFSDGETVDADDIIFSYYVLSDPTYTGSSTLYSYDILGMTNYRMNNSMAEVLSVSAEELAAELDNPGEDSQAFIEGFVSDVLVSELDWVKSLYGDDGWASYTEMHPIPKDLYAMFYNLDENYDSYTVEDETQVLNDILAQYGSDWKMLSVNYGGSESYFQPDIEGGVGEILLSNKLASSEGLEVPAIEGIKKLSQTEVEVKVRGFEAPAVYSICGIDVAPMHYYGDATMYDYDNNMFGFTRGDLSIVESKTSQPMGAGPYKFIKYEDKIVYYEANENYYKGEPETKYLQLKETTDGEMIAGVGTGEIDIANPSGSVAKFEELKAFNSNNETVGDVITASSVNNLGYGYIGINAVNVNVAGDISSEASKNLRKAFATIYAVYRDVSIDSYYGDAAMVINYPISNTSWAAPQKADAGYEIAFSKDVDGNPIYTSDMIADDKYAAALEAAKGFFIAAGYTFDETTGMFTAAPEGASLEYEVIVPGDGTGEHPAFAMLTDSREALAKLGITLTINDPSDTNVLWDSIDSNTHVMWTAAWGSTLDPDMYQVYHSSNGIGLGGTDSNSYNIADPELDKLIMDARQSSDQSFRKATYKQALDIILDWGVEVPNYQRQNLVIFSTERVNMSTVTPDITTYWVWMNDIELIKMN